MLVVMPIEAMATELSACPASALRYTEIASGTWSWKMEDMEDGYHRCVQTQETERQDAHGASYTHATAVGAVGMDPSLSADTPPTRVQAITG